MSDFTKGEGGKIVIKFDRPLVGDVSGSKPAFTISGYEPRWIGDTPQPKTYTIDSVARHPIQTQDSILITMAVMSRFNNAVGDITVEYDATKGTLAGIGGAVESFTHSFTPEGLETKGNPAPAEHISATLNNYSIAMTKINFSSATNKEYISAAIDNYQINLIDIDDINP